MPMELVNLFGAVTALASWALTQAWIAPLAAGVVGARSLPTKAPTLIEMVRSVFFGGFAWLFVGAVQALIAQGV